jgi:3'(2'), 5'-bisphosphate nucleotidase
VTDEDLAAQLAEDAGKLLLKLLLAKRDGALPAEIDLGMVADKAANSLILNGLAEARPGDAVLSEECPDNPERTGNSRCWIIDPLDGTREYGEGRSDWAVHVALAVDGRPALGAVALPALKRLYRSDDRLAAAPKREQPVIAVSRTRPPENAPALAAALGAKLMEAGSAGAKAMAVAGGEADLYFHAGGQHQWDNCAPAAVALGLGLHASRIDGSPLVYNGADTNLPDVLIGRPDLAERAIAFIQGRH